MIDKPILDLLNIDADTPLSIKTDGRSLVISPSDPLLFLETHDFKLRSSKQEAGDLVLAVASGRADKPACTAFFKQHVT